MRVIVTYQCDVDFSVDTETGQVMAVHIQDEVLDVEHPIHVMTDEDELGPDDTLFKFAISIVNREDEWPMPVYGW